jgi:transposase InsO family protein
MVAFGFGLVHGLGLAGGLMEGGFRREVLALAVVSFRERVVPAFRRASWPVQRVLTDRGSEFKGAFDEACRVLGIRHTRTKPRHAFTNGFVERLQQTILHDHWRVEFRRRYFTKSHHGYRTRGRTPAQLVWGAQDAEA